MITSIHSFKPIVKACHKNKPQRASHTSEREEIFAVPTCVTPTVCSKKTLYLLYGAPRVPPAQGPQVTQLLQAATWFPFPSVLGSAHYNSCVSDKLQFLGMYQCETLQ